MYGSDEFVAYLKEKNINIYSADELREKGKDIDKNLKWFEKTNNTTQKTVEESAKYSAKKFSKESVLKQKKIVKVIGWVLLALNVVAFLFLKGKTELSVYILTIFTIWFMYIILYPKMFLEIPAVSKKSRDYVIEMPFLAGGVSLLFCVGTVDMFEYATKEYIAYFFVLTALLVLPFLIKVFSFVFEIAYNTTTIIAPHTKQMLLAKIAFGALKITSEAYRALIALITCLYL